VFFKAFPLGPIHLQFPLQESPKEKTGVLFREDLSGVYLRAGLCKRETGVETVVLFRKNLSPLWGTRVPLKVGSL
jgi:hypothetical protein